MPVSPSAQNVPTIVLGELIPPIPAPSIAADAHGQVEDVTMTESLPPSKRRPAMPYAVDPALAQSMPRGSLMLSITADFLLTVASLWRKFSGEGHFVISAAYGLRLSQDCAPSTKFLSQRDLHPGHGGTHASSSRMHVCLLSFQQLLVVLHTAQCTRSVAETTMPSPAANLKAARRLPKRLRISGEEPQGDIARMRAEATAGESRRAAPSTPLFRGRAQPGLKGAMTGGSAVNGAGMPVGLDLAQC